MLAEKGDVIKVRYLLVPRAELSLDESWVIGKLEKFRATQKNKFCNRERFNNRIPLSLHMVQPKGCPATNVLSCNKLLFIVMRRFPDYD
jgi:hypothetical protein